MVARWGAPKAAPFPRGPIYQPFAGADFLGEIGEILGLYDNFGAVDLGPAALGAGGGRDKGGQGKGEGEESRAQHNGPI